MWNAFFMRKRAQRDVRWRVDTIQSYPCGYAGKSPSFDLGLCWPSPLQSSRGFFGAIRIRAHPPGFRRRGGVRPLRRAQAGRAAPRSKEPRGSRRTATERTNGGGRPRPVTSTHWMGRAKPLLSLYVTGGRNSFRTPDQRCIAPRPSNARGRGWGTPRRPCVAP